MVPPSAPFEFFPLQTANYGGFWKMLVLGISMSITTSRRQMVIRRRRRLLRTLREGHRQNKAAANVARTDAWRGPTSRTRAALDANWGTPDSQPSGESTSGGSNLSSASTMVSSRTRLGP